MSSLLNTCHARRPFDPRKPSSTRGSMSNPEAVAVVDTLFAQSPAARHLGSPSDALVRHLAVIGVAIGLAACGDSARPIAPRAPAPAINTSGRAGTLAKPVALSSAGAPGLVIADLGTGVTPVDLARTIVGPNVAVSNVIYTGPATAAAKFSHDDGILGLGRGIVISSGNANFVVGPNSFDNITAVNGTPGDSGLSGITGMPSLDATILTFDFVPAADRMSIKYVFTSDEYNEFVNSPFDDAFALYINGVNCATVRGQPVSVNRINHGNPFGSEPWSNGRFFRNNDLTDGGAPVNTEMDGLTTVLSCEAALSPNVVNTMRLVIADMSDPNLDSNVFIRAHK